MPRKQNSWSLSGLSRGSQIVRHDKTGTRARTFSFGKVKGKCGLEEYKFDGGEGAEARVRLEARASDSQVAESSRFAMR